MQDVTAHTAPVISHIEDATAQTAIVTAHAASGAIKPPFGPTATAHEKMAKLFLKLIFRQFRKPGKQCSEVG